MAVSEKDKKILAQNLCYYKQKYDKTRHELAAVVGVSDPMMSKYLTAQMYPRYDKIKKLADYFNITPADLMEDKAEAALKATPTDLDMWDRLDNILIELKDPECKTIYDGVVLDDTSRAILINTVENLMDNLKLIQSKKELKK